MSTATQLTVENLISTGAHFGHLTSRWHPNYKPYIFSQKNGIHIIDIQQTINCLDASVDVLTKLVKDGGTVLFVGTKKQAKDVLQREADRCGMYYVVERWLGGTLTNYSTIKKSIKRLVQLEKDADTLYQSLTKKEILQMERERIRLADLHRGIKDMKRLPDALFVVDVKYELTAVKEAQRLEIPIFAIVDSNTDPRLVDYPIPANDDSLRAIQLITSTFADAIIAARGGRPEPTEEELAQVVAETATKIVEQKPKEHKPAPKKEPAEKAAPVAAKKVTKKVEKEAPSETKKVAADKAKTEPKAAAKAKSATPKPKAKPAKKAATKAKKTTDTEKKATEK